MALPAMSPRTRHDPVLECAASRDSASPSLEIAVEGNAVGQQVPDPVRAFLDHRAGDLLVDGTGARLDRVGQMLLERVAVAHRGGDPALRPGGRDAPSPIGARCEAR